MCAVCLLKKVVESTYKLLLRLLHDVFEVRQLE